MGYRDPSRTATAAVLALAALAVALLAHALWGAGQLVQGAGFGHVVPAPWMAAHEASWKVLHAVLAVALVLAVSCWLWWQRRVARNQDARAGHAASASGWALVLLCCVPPVNLVAPLWLMLELERRDRGPDAADLQALTAVWWVLCLGAASLCGLGWLVRAAEYAPILKLVAASFLTAADVLALGAIVLGVKMLREITARQQRRRLAERESAGR